MATYTLVDLLTDQRFVLQGERLVAGRGESAQISLPDPTCSRTHFQLQAVDAGFLVEPLSPTNPTYLDGQPLSGPARLMPDAIIQAGNTRLRFEVMNSEVTRSVASHPACQTIVADAHIRGSLSLEGPIQLVDGRFTIGRDPSCSLQIGHPQVSRFHAALMVQGDQATICDLGAANGTFVNGRMLQSNRESKLYAGDHLDIGPYGLTFSPGRLLPHSRINNIELVGAEVSRVVTDRQTGQPLTILDQVSLVIRPKEFVCLLGPSGSGKTTLMGVLSGRVKPDEGSVLLNGQNLHVHFEALKKDIAYVPQKDVMHDKLTVGEALTFTGLLRLPADLTQEERCAGVDEILQTVALTDRRGTQISHLSGGQVKRASLANEILSKPSLLFLDEVTSGLDEQTDRDMMALFRRVADTGKTVVCITHSLTNVEGYCDLVVVLTPGGKMAFVGKPEEAVAYFGVARLGDVYARLAEEPVDVWRQRFRATEFHQRYVEARLKNASPQTNSVPPPPPKLSNQAKSSLRQGLLLAMRYLLIWRSSPGALLSMAGQTLLVAALLILVFGDVSGIGNPVNKVSRTENLLFLLAVSAFWFGCNNSAKEVVKERIIYQRERNYNLLAGSYLASKVFVLAGIGLLQVLLLFGLVQFFCQPPCDLVPQGLLIVLLSLAGTALGLVISAAAGSEEVAIALIPVAVIPQIILSGAIAPLSGAASWLAMLGVTTYWGKRGLDQLLPDELRSRAVEMDLAVDGSYLVASLVVAAHSAFYLLVALLILHWRGQARK